LAQREYPKALEVFLDGFHHIQKQDADFDKEYLPERTLYQTDPWKYLEKLKTQLEEYLANQATVNSKKKTSSINPTT
jgi:hypothetical protein